MAALREALGLWRTPVAFADLVDTAYPAAEAARLVELRGSATEALIEAAIDAEIPRTPSARPRPRSSSGRSGSGCGNCSSWPCTAEAGRATRSRRTAGPATRCATGSASTPAPRYAGWRHVSSPTIRPCWPPRGASPRPCPYKGLARYDEDDADLFVGRERLVEELLARLVDGSLLVVVGPSGHGQVLSGARGPGAGPSPGWSSGLGGLGASPSWFRAGVLRRSVHRALSGRPAVLVVDQFEEALLGSGVEFTAVADALLAASRGGVRVVLVLRADFFGLLARASRARSPGRPRDGSAGAARRGGTAADHRRAGDPVGPACRPRADRPDHRPGP